MNVYQNHSHGGGFSDNVVLVLNDDHKDMQGKRNHSGLSPMAAMAKGQVVWIRHVAKKIRNALDGKQAATIVSSDHEDTTVNTFDDDPYGTTDSVGAPSEKDATSGHVDDIVDVTACDNKSKDFEDVYEIGKLLGEGMFAVFQCRHLETSRTYAAKECKLVGRDIDNDIEDEIFALQQLKDCPHIISLVDVFDADSTAPNPTTWIVLEEMKGGDVMDVLQEIEIYKVNEACELMRNLLEAVAYCHKRKICHRDIKPENILLPRKDNITSIKLADFGTARQWNDQASKMTTFCGTKTYIAPELVTFFLEQGEGYTSQCDLWACGVVLYLILGGYLPFDAEMEEELFRMICEAGYAFHDEYWQGMDSAPMELIDQLLEVDPEKRLTALEALDSPWLKAPVPQVMS